MQPRRPRVRKVAWIARAQDNFSCELHLHVWCPCGSRTQRASFNSGPTKCFSLQSLLPAFSRKQAEEQEALALVVPTHRLLSSSFLGLNMNYLGAFGYPDISRSQALEVLRRLSCSFLSRPKVLRPRPPRRHGLGFRVLGFRASGLYTDMLTYTFYTDFCTLTYM